VLSSVQFKGIFCILFIIISNKHICYVIHTKVSLKIKLNIKEDYVCVRRILEVEYSFPRTVILRPFVMELKLARSVVKNENYKDVTRELVMKYYKEH